MSYYKMNDVWFTCFSSVDEVSLLQISAVSGDSGFTGNRVLPADFDF
jgi:hypothetical protein